VTPLWTKIGLEVNSIVWLSTLPAATLTSSDDAPVSAVLSIDDASVAAVPAAKIEMLRCVALYIVSS